MNSLTKIGKTPGYSQTIIEEDTLLTETFPTITLPKGSKSKKSGNLLTDAFIMTPDQRNQQFINNKKLQTQEINKAAFMEERKAVK